MPAPPPPASPSFARHTRGEPSEARLATYVFLEPLVVGRDVVDVGPPHEAGASRFLRAGAAALAVSKGGVRGLSEVPDGSVDVVTCLTSPGDQGWDAGAVDELDRVLRPGGFWVARLQAGAEAPGVAEDQLTSLARLAAERFPVQEVVQERNFLGVSFSVRGVDEIAVNEELGHAEGVDDHVLLFAARGERPPWQLTESLLVPVTGAGPGSAVRDPEGEGDDAAALRARAAEAEARAAAFARGGDALRETLMDLQDETARRDETIARLRGDAERLLERLAAEAGALELASLARDGAEARAAAAERELTDTLVSLRRREVEVLALERELARLRGKLAG